MKEHPKHPLTPEQAADVITYYHEAANREVEEHGRSYKVPLGEAALRATMWRHSILPNGEAPLTFNEMQIGLAHIDHPPEPRPPIYYFDIPELIDAYDPPARVLEREAE